MNRAKSIISTFVIVISLMVTALDLCCEMPKIPALLEDYSSFHETDDSSFWQFIVEHLTDQKSGESNHNEGNHNNLPFHGNHSHVCHNTPVLHPSSQYPNGSLLTFYVEVIASQPKITLSCIYLESPFQPPKQA